MVERDLDVVVYGATGYTGRLIAHALDALDVTIALAGRDAQRLDALSAELEGKPEVVTVSVDDAPRLRAMARRARCVLSAAGPFVRLGPPVMRAALESGAHFADITGEQAFLRWAFGEHGRAKDADVAVVNACGFDVIPSDWAATLATRGMTRVEAVDIGINAGKGMSAGTRRSSAETAGEGAWYDHGQYRAGPPGRFRRSFRFPEPWGERDAIFIPWGDVVTAPRSTGAHVVRTFFTMKPDRARVLGLAWPLTAVALRLPMIRADLQRKAERAPAGPSPEEREQQRFGIVAEATDDTGRVQRGVVTGRDPYGLTGVTAALAAVKLARGDVTARGVLTPSQAFDLDAFTREVPDRFELKGEVQHPA